MNAKNPFLLSGLIVSLGLIVAFQVTSQTITTLYSFNGGVDGANPCANLVISNGILYGTTSKGLGSGEGTVFKINTNGTGFFVFYQFTGGNAGTNLYDGLVFSGGTLYGAAESGGANGAGTVFAIQTNGVGFFTALKSFATPFFGSPPYQNNDGANPYGGLTLSGKTLFGTAYNGGSSGYGAIFAVNTNGIGFTNLYSFSGSFPDEGNPYGTLILSGDTLYGTAFKGNSLGYGSVFKINTNGTGFTTLHTFSATSSLYNTNSDGANPYGGLALSGNTLYGTTYNGGSSGNGVVFAVNTDGTGFKVLHHFTATPNYLGEHGAGAANSDGIGPATGLILWSNTLYGTAAYGGNSGNGTVFAINTNGTVFTTLYSFAASSPNIFGIATNSDGAYPYGSLVLSGSILYGTTSKGSTGYGTVFSLSLPPPPLTVIHSTTNVILMWPTYAPGVTLQSTTNLVPSVVWSTNLPSPVLVSGQNTVTNSISGKQMFYRLSQ